MAKKRGQNKIHFDIGYIAPAFYNFFMLVYETLNLNNYGTKVPKNFVEKEKEFKDSIEKDYFSMLYIHNNVLKEYYKYWECKKILEGIQPKFDLFNLGLTVGNSLEQIAKSNYKIDQALEELKKTNDANEIRNYQKLNR